MLRIFLCEDDSRWRKRLETIITDYIVSTDYEIKLALSTHSPTDILDYLEQHPTKAGMYILDVDLQHELNGIALAEKIRRIDPRGKIVFVTTHGELAYLTFRHRVEALDYIIKDQQEQIPQKLQEAIEFTCVRYQEEFLDTTPHFQIKTGREAQNIPLEEIMFFASHPSQPHKLILHITNGRIEFYGALSEISESNPDFFRSHQSYVVNTKNIKRIDKTTRVLEMVNGETAIVTVRKIKTLMDTMGIVE